MRDTMDKSYIGCYWGDRQQSLPATAATLATALTALGDLNPMFSTWFETGTSASLDTPIQTDNTTLTSLLEAGVNRTDFGDDALPRLGYSFDLWNGATDDHASSFSGTVGVHAGKPSIVNNVVLTLPGAYSPDAALFELMVDAWDPEWATWASRSLRRAQGRDFRQVVGWSTYVRSSIPDDTPAGVRTRRLANGTVVTIEKDHADTNDLGVITVRDWLATVGVLTPVRQP